MGIISQEIPFSGSSVIAGKIIDARTTGQASGSGEEKKRIRVKFDENIYTVINWYFLTVQ